MSGEYYKQHPERSGFADTGLVVAVAVIVITALKLVMYGITIVSLSWLLLSILYVGLAAATKADSVFRKGITTFYLAVSALGIFASMYYDNPIVPKKESALQTQQDENQYGSDAEVKIETPEPVKVETDVVQENMNTYENVSTDEIPVDYPEMNPQDEDDIEVIDLNEYSGDNNADESKSESEYNSPSLPEQQTEEGFDESFN